ncbi:vomeronasal 1 receptor monDomV1R1259 [Monodelphis domestica]|uniref:Vomeronasal type-1 receptor n=1 Tax=Monodelphis domestica TaxID=13616 RepID=F6Z3R2_MONDO|nr:vomeronasal 1 receptor monDomV1R1259 [Monodelphis domestica]
MSSHKESPEIVYFTLFFFGILGNTFLLSLHAIMFITEHRKRLIRLIIINMAFAHILMILFRGIHLIINNWGWTSLLDDTIAKIFIFFIILTRGVSLCSTCLLGIFQALTISPRSLNIKTRAQNYILLCCVLSWIFNLLFNITLPLNMSSPRNSSEERWRIGHISFGLHAIIIKPLIYESLVNALLVGLMICSSGYMVFVLYRHNQQVQHIHNIRLSSRASPETRATKVILMTVITFVCFNSASSPFVIYVASTKETRHWALLFTVLLSLFYPIVSPFMLIIMDTQISQAFCFLLGFNKSFQKEYPC